MSLVKLTGIVMALLAGTALTVSGYIHSYRPAELSPVMRQVEAGPMQACEGCPRQDVQPAQEEERETVTHAA